MINSIEKIIKTFCILGIFAALLTGCKTVTNVNTPQVSTMGMGGSSMQPNIENSVSNYIFDVAINTTNAITSEGFVDISTLFGGAPPANDTTTTNFTQAVTMRKAGTVVLDTSGLLLKSSAGAQTMNWGTHLLTDSTLATSADWNNRLMYDNANTVLDWATQTLKTDAGSTTIDWGQRVLKDSGGNSVVDWSGKQLKSGASTVLDWGFGTLKDDAAFQWEVEGTPVSGQDVMSYSATETLIAASGSSSERVEYDMSSSSSWSLMSSYGWQGNSMNSYMRTNTATAVFNNSYFNYTYINSSQAGHYRVKAMVSYYTSDASDISWGISSSTSLGTAKYGVGAYTIGCRVKTADATTRGLAVFEGIFTNSGSSEYLYLGANPNAATETVYIEWVHWSVEKL